MKPIKTYLFSAFFLAFNVLGILSFAQSACPSVTVSPTPVSICSGCTTLTATIQGTNATTSYSVSPTAYTPFSYNTGTAVLVNVDDQWSSVVPLPFCFDFYGTTYNQVVIGANELISFDVTPAGGYCPWTLTSGTPIPTSSWPMNSIMGPYQDIDPTFMGSIYWQVTGTAPCRAFVVSFYQVPYFGDPNSVNTSSCSGPLFATSQIVLYEATNIIDIYIKDKPVCTGWNNGLAIEGIQNATGTQAVAVAGRNNTVWTATNDAYRFTPTGAAQYSLTWYAPPNTAIGTSNTVSVCPTVTTTYTATVVNNTCSTPIIVSAMATVNIGASSTPSVTSTPASCTANSGTATANPASGSPPFTYLWSTTPPQVTQTANSLAAGTYSVTVTDALGCSSTGTVTVANQGGVTVSAVVNSNILCFGANNGSATATPAGGTLPYTYVWTSGQSTAVASGLSAGNFTVTLTDVNGCTDTALVSITEPPAIGLSYTTTPSLCGGSSGSASIMATGGITPYTYLWTPGGQNSQTITGLSSGTYTVVVTDANGCDSAQVITITGVGGIGATASVVDSILCNGGSNGSASANPTGGIMPYSYLWNNGQTDQIATGLSAGNYSVTVKDSIGCVGTATISLSDPPPVATTYSSSADTCGKQVGTSTVTPVGGLSPYTYLWVLSPVQTGPTATGLSPGPYTCVITDANGCTSINTSTVTSVPGPTADFSFDPTVVDVLDGTVNFSDLSTSDVVSWAWGFGDSLGVSILQNPSYTYTAEGTYVIVLVVLNSSGCPDTVQHTILVEGYSTFYVPNTFTPNHDGLNDFFAPVCSGIENEGYAMMIFDRWGNLIFETKTLGVYWDGSVDNKGDTVQEDVYVYVITYLDVKEVQHRLIGNVNVVR